MKKKMYLAALAFACSATLALPVHADEVSDLENSKAQVQNQATTVNKQLVDLLTTSNILESDMKGQKKKIKQADEDYKVAQETETKQYEAMKKRIKYMYENGSTDSVFNTLVTATSFTDLVNKVEYTSSIHSYDKKQLATYQETKKQVVAQKEELQAEQTQMKALSEDYKEQQGELEATLTELKSQVSNFDEQLAAAKEEAAKKQAELEAETKAMAEAAAQQEAKDNSSDAAKDTDTDSSDLEETKKPSATKKPTASSNDSNDSSDSKKTTTPKKTTAPTEAPKKTTAPKKTATPTKKPTATKAPSNASVGQQIANTACNYIGGKYVYGGTSLTKGIDCSGFTQAIHKKYGISLPRTSSAQRSGGKAVKYSDALPGDVVCYSGHVGIYIGGGKICHASNSAPYPKGGIKISTIGASGTVLAIRRYW